MAAEGAVTMEVSKGSTQIRIITVGKDTELVPRLRRLFADDEIDVIHESSIDRVLERFESAPYDVLIVTSAAFKAVDINALELLEVIAANSPTTQILFLVEPPDIQTAMSALKAGTYRYAKLPISDEELRLLIQTAIENRPLYGTNLFLEARK